MPKPIGAGETATYWVSPADVKRRVKALAALHGRSVNEEITQAVSAWVLMHDGDGVLQRDALQPRRRWPT